MNDESIQHAISQLGATPTLLRELLCDMDLKKLRTKPAPGLFSPLEDAWHLRDIEREGYLVRIRRMLTEQSPALVDLNGDEMAMHGATTSSSWHRPSRISRARGRSRSVCSRA